MIVALSVVLVVVCISRRRSTSKATITKDQAGVDQDLMQNRAYGSPSDINGIYGVTPTHIVQQEAPSNATDIRFALSSSNGAYGITGEPTYDTIPDTFPESRGTVTLLRVPQYTASSEAVPSCYTLPVSSNNQLQHPKAAYIS